MQQERDYIDDIIFSSIEDLEIDEGYNRRLLSKLHKKIGINKKIQYRIAACSLILSGLLMMFVYTSNMEYKMLNAEYKFKVQALMIMENLNINRLFLGE